MITKDNKILSVLDTLPRRHPTQKMVVVLITLNPLMDMLNICSSLAFISSSNDLAYFLCCSLQDL